MTGPTANAVDFRKGHTKDECDTFDEAFDPVSAAIEGADTDGLLAALREHGSGMMGVAGRGFAPKAVSKTDTPTPTQTPIPATNTPTKTPTVGPTNTVGPSPSATNTSAPTATFTPISGPQQQYTVDPDCNPWAAGGACQPSPSTADCSRQIFYIPIIDQFGNGSSDPVTILGFALVFMEGYDSGKCQGNSCEIKARFVQAEITTGALGGSYDPNSPVHFVKLVE
jgi:hypothetical protein